MAPGPKKKSFHKKVVENKSDTKKGCLKNECTSEKKIPDEQISLDQKEREFKNENLDFESKKYSKRSIINNWQKYEETVADPFADTLRGEDLEVLLSYSGGTGSQLQLQEEKEWEEVGFNEKQISVDLQDIVHIIKCIPFHKLLNVSSAVFSEDQIIKFNLSAENWKNSYSVNTNMIPKSNNVLDEETMNSSVNLVSSYEVDDIGESMPLSSVCLKENTETIIESLASCLALKPPLKPESSEKKIKTPDIPDDLDFLLSLNVSLKNPVQEEYNESKTNIDDWLNSILDD